METGQLKQTSYSFRDPFPSKTARQPIRCLHLDSDTLEGLHLISHATLPLWARHNSTLGKATYFEIKELPEWIPKEPLGDTLSPAAGSCPELCCVWWFETEDPMSSFRVNNSGLVFSLWLLACFFSFNFLPCKGLSSVGSHADAARLSHLCFYHILLVQLATGHS